MGDLIAPRPSTTAIGPVSESGLWSKNVLPSLLGRGFETRPSATDPTRQPVGTWAAVGMLCTDRFPDLVAS